MIRSKTDATAEVLFWGKYFLDLFSNFEMVWYILAILKYLAGMEIEQITSGPYLVSRTGDVGWTKRKVKVPKIEYSRNPERESIHLDSRTVATEVGIR